MQLEQILVMVPVLLFSIVAHEYAHAEAAYRQGDQTAYMLGRLTLNPLKHIDPFMSVIFPIFLIVSGASFIFAAAKPVPVNPRNYRRYVRGDIIVSLAGIATNLVLFVVSAIGFAVVGSLGRGAPPLEGTLAILQQMMVWGMRVNLILAFFNLIPIPPLDGSHVFKFLLPPGAGLQFRQLYRLGILPILLVVWFLPRVVDFFLWPAHQLLDLAWATVGGSILPGVSWPL